MSALRLNLLLIGLLLAASVLSLLIGRGGSLALWTLWVDDPASARVILWQLRLPRLLLAILVGASLGLSGAVLQGLLRNPLAEPSLLGTSSGAALGAVVPGDAYWPRIKEICTKYGVLLIADEVMVGLGRTGKVFAINHWHVEPDLIVLGKGLAAGYQPLGAVLAGPKVVDAFQKNSGIFEHGYTYSGHPVAAAAGLACLEFLARENLVERVAEMQTFFFSKLEELRKYEFVGDIRGRGLFAGIEFVEDKQSKKPFDAVHKFSKKIIAAATANGVLIYPGSAFIDGVSGDHVLIAPPFIATKAELDEMFDRLDAAFSSVQTIQRS